MDSSLRFDNARFDSSGPDGLECALCQSGIGSTYFEVNGQTACEKCRWDVERSRSEGSSLGRLFRAVLGGGVGGAVGAGIYYAILALTGYELALVAIVVGLLVGVGVRWGSGGIGGRGYQLLAVAITYLAIVSTYVPFIYEEIVKQSEASAPEAMQQPAAADEPVPEGGEAVMMGLFALGILMVIAMASPFLAGIQNVIGILIIGFALYEAWKVNAFTPLQIEGPFQVGRTSPGG